MTIPSDRNTPPRHRFACWRLLASLLLLAAVAAGAGPYLWLLQSEVPEPPVISTEGVDRDLVAAIETARAAVREAPRSAEAWGRLGQLLVTYEYLVEGKTCLMQAEKLDPRDPRWPYQQAMILRWTNLDTIPKLERTVQLCGDKPPEPRLRLAGTLLSEGGIPEAEEQFQRVLAAHPGYPWAHVGLAEAALSRDDPKAALGHLEPALVRSMLPKAYHTLRAESYQRLGQPETAEAELRQSRTMPGDLPPPDPFRETFRAQSSALRLEQAISQLKQYRLEEGVSLYEELQEHPDSVEAWLWLGRARLRKGNRNGAEAAFRRAVEVASTAAEPQYFLGMALLEQGQTKAAANCFRRALAAKPNYPLAYRMLSQCAQKDGDKEAAVEGLRSAIRYAPHLAFIQFELAELLLGKGQKAEAAVHLRGALRLEPENEKAKKLLAEVEPPAPPGKP